MTPKALSLIELVVVVVIFGLLAAVAIPRFSAGATHDPGRELRARLALLRTAIALYYQDHGTYPGRLSAGAPDADSATGAAFVRQLTQYTDRHGHASPTPSPVFCYGPYLEHGIPACPVSGGEHRSDVHVITGSAAPGYCAQAPAAGWVYNCDTGYIAANSAETDMRGVRYDTY